MCACKSFMFVACLSRMSQVKERKKIKIGRKMGAESRNAVCGNVLINAGPNERRKPIMTNATGICAAQTALEMASTLYV